MADNSICDMAVRKYGFSKLCVKQNLLRRYWKTNSMNYQIIADTHFGHKNIQKYCNRPENCDGLMLENIKKSIREGDVFIHLGDICFGDDIKWHEKLFKAVALASHHWLVLGNHDKKSMNWYLFNGWDFVGTAIGLDIYGRKFLLTHEYTDARYGQINIHGHSHNSTFIPQNQRNHRKLIAVETMNYSPVSLKDLA
jgi:calcineurin-like phosphoesterase family protein